MNYLVPGDQWGVVVHPVRDDETVKGITRPAEPARDLGNVIERAFSSTKTDLPIQVGDDVAGSGANSPDLEKVLKLQHSHWRDNEFFHFEEPTRRGRDQVGATLVEPQNDMGIEVDQGRHSDDQSM